MSNALPTSGAADSHTAPVPGQVRITPGHEAPAQHGSSNGTRRVRHLPGVLIRPAEPGEYHAALKLVLGQAGQPADDTRVTDFLRFAVQRRIDLSLITLALEDRGPERKGQGGTILWAVLPVAPVGRSALLLAPSSPPSSGDLAGATDPARAIDIASQLIHATLSSLPGLHIAQALVEVNNPLASAPFLSAGFSQLAILQYLVKRVSSAPVAPKLPHSLQLHTYSPATHPLFRDAIAASYVGSQDCPALDGLRDVDDIIEGHKASGDFIPSLWYVLTHSAHPQPAATLLLSPTGNGETLELVYLGVSQPFRRQGLGHWAIRQALHDTHRLGLPKLTLAVDSANRPALKLYHRFGLQHIHERLALMKNLRSPVAGHAPSEGMLEST